MQLRVQHVQSRNSSDSARSPHTRRNEVTVQSRNIQQLGGSKPLFTVTMKSNGSTNEKDRLSRIYLSASAKLPSDGGTGSRGTAGVQRRTA